MSFNEPQALWMFEPTDQQTLSGPLALSRAGNKPAWIISTPWYPAASRTKI